MSEPNRARLPIDVSVVIPTFNEEASIGASVRSAIEAGAGEVIVTDGGSTDQTQRRATDAGADKWVRSLPGRGTQLAGGLSIAEKDIVLFLHADNRLDRDCLNQICGLGEFVWGAFRQRIDSPRHIYRLIEYGNSARVRVRSMAFGDQAIFVDRKVLMQNGGVSEIPLLEDVDLSRRLRKLSRPKMLSGPVTISPRRWEENGIAAQTFRNWSIQVQYALGARAEALAQKY